MSSGFLRTRLLQIGPFRIGNLSSAVLRTESPNSYWTCAHQLFTYLWISMFFGEAKRRRFHWPYVSELIAERCLARPDTWPTRELSPYIIITSPSEFTWLVTLLATHGAAPTKG